MIKRIVHIDQDFPRRLSEQTGKPLSKMNWGFDTQAATDDINGDISDSSQAVGTLTQDDVSQSTYVDQLYDDMQLTQQQLDNLSSHSNDGKQIRFNANVFNYIVHTEIDNVILKYDAPVVYTEGIENKYTGEFTWKEKYLVVEGRPYHIIFDILMHDPMGIDRYCYEAWLRGDKFGHFDRKTPNEPSTVSPQEQIDYAEFVNETQIQPHHGKWDIAPALDKYITIHSTTEHFKIDKMLDPYQTEDGPESAFKITVQLGGKGYDTDYINTSPAKYDAWKTAITQNASEEAICQAWNECEGVKFKFFDVAGNVTYWVMPYVEIVVVTLEDLYNIKKLLLEFINTHPEDLQLGTDLIGRTTIKVTNPNSKFSDCDILIDLDEASLGELYKNTRKEKYITIDGKHVAKIATEDVGNIDDSGWVIAHAMIDIPDFIDELEDLRTMVKNLSRADGSLGEWIKECSDNLRKITLDPFVPQYLKETTNKNSAYYKFVKFTERYLNTMFKAYDKNCYISVLEAIARIGNFNDYTTIYKNLLDKYDNDHGDMLHITADELGVIINADRQEPAEDETESN